jgi:hypothetical protein
VIAISVVSEIIYRRLSFMQELGAWTSVMMIAMMTMSLGMPRALHCRVAIGQIVANRSEIAATVEAMPKKIVLTVASVRDSAS